MGLLRVKQLFIDYYYDFVAAPKQHLFNIVTHLFPDLVFKETLLNEINFEHVKVINQMPDDLYSRLSDYWQEKIAQNNEEFN